MEHQNTSRQMSRVFRGLVLSLALILVACGGDADDPTPEATSGAEQAAVPTTPPLESTPDADVSEDEITVLAPDIQATPDASTPEAVGDAGSPEPVADDGDERASGSPQATIVDLTGVDETEDVEIAATPSTTDEPTVVEDEVTPPSQVEATTDESTPGAADESEAVVAQPTERARTGNETFDHPGDGTGGSGMPGELNSVDEVDDSDLSATPEASPIAQLSITGCDVPDVPGFLGETSTFILLTDINFRSGPGVDCDPVMDDPLGEGQIVEVVGGPVTQAEDGSEWVQIDIDGQPGWITTEFIEPTE